MPMAMFVACCSIQSLGIKMRFEFATLLWSVGSGLLRGVGRSVGR